jgi:integrase
MKTWKEHRCPLSGRAEAILVLLASIRTNDFIFAGARTGKGLSNMTMASVLRRMEYGHVTSHGFRSCFRGWAAERTNTPNIVCENNNG